MYHVTQVYSWAYAQRRSNLIMEIHRYAHCHSVHNSKEMESPQTSINR